MLQIKNISKRYKTGELVQTALDDVSLNFRDNEFVSILGPSGSGKTTLLNIIGGLDRYDKGNLIINNVSTKAYLDRDWDSYRNHTVGFVFQSYNLIPHQSVLANVELALTIGGISKAERKRRALEALDKVGLKEQAHKKPNQMSGGQMQRVAIARALVNNPDILLADEPTGALDSETSLQVMELLKEVAKDRLVIMVTHNPELAETYSTRIVKLRDGKVIDDSNPFNIDETKMEKPRHRNLGKASMSVFTALSLSLNNLLTKKGRTILTSFAGSIGIIGIALILSLSNGFQNYIDKIQEDTLTSYPLTITAETADAASMLLSMTTENADGTVGKEEVKETQNVKDMFTKIGKNDLRYFKSYLEANTKKVNEMTSLVKYTYNVSPLIYSKNSDNEIVQLNPSTLLSSLMGGSMGSMSNMMVGSNVIFNELLDNDSMLKSQYDLLKGKWPEKYDEVILILPEPNSISDLLLYSLGLRDGDELKDMLADLMQDKEVVNNNKPLTYTYDELMALELKLVDSTSTYKYNKKYDIYESMKENKEFMEGVYNDAETLKIVGIVTPSDDASMMSGIGYTRALTMHVINKASESEIVKKQLANESINVFNNKRFDDKSNDTGLDFEDLISVDEKALKEAFGGNVDENTITDMTKGYIGEIEGALTTDTKPAETLFLNTLATLTTNTLKNYIAEKGVGGMATLSLNDVDSVVAKELDTKTSTDLINELEKDYIVPAKTFKATYNQFIVAFLKQYITMANVSPVGEVASTMIMENMVENIVTAFVSDGTIQATAKQMGTVMTEAAMKTTVLTKVGELSAKLVETMAGAFKVDANKIASAFTFEMDEEEMKRLFETFSSTSTIEDANTNLISLGYQDLNEPTSISFYFENFEDKERLIGFLDDFNEKMEKEDDEKVIKYTDLTGILMSSVKTIVDSVSYVLIAFVSISLIVSSIMIGIITYISVLERTKEIGVLRAIGASKKNISSIFNAETFIVGLFAGIIGIATTLLLLIPINSIIHLINKDILAVLPMGAAVILVILSVILTLIGGLIPSKQAAKKDPVLALRTE